MTTDALCIICGDGQPAPMSCRRCEHHIRSDLDDIGRMRRTLHEWCEIDPGTPGRDEPHRLALVDNPILTASGRPDLTVIAATDIRSRRIPDNNGGWDQDDVVNIDWELVTEARRISNTRRLATPLNDVFDAIRVLNISFDWSIRSDRILDHAGILNGCAQALRGILHDTTDRIIGECTAAHHERDTCGGPLRFAWIGPLSIDEAAQVRPTHVQCGWCRDTWPCDAATLIGMVKAVGALRPMPVPKVWAVETLGISDGWVRKWVMLDAIRRYPDGSVDLGDVIRQMDRDGRRRDTPEPGSA